MRRRNPTTGSMVNVIRLASDRADRDAACRILRLTVVVGDDFETAEFRRNLSPRASRTAQQEA